MNKIAQFEKISFERFKDDFGRALNLSPANPQNIEQLKQIYDNIKLPQRATSGSAGYDFFMPYNMETSFDKPILFPTGIKCRIKKGWMLQIYPRSSYGIKYGIRLSNTVGIIDSDYYNNPDNEGHIWVELIADDEHEQNITEISAHDKVCQGIFVRYGITHDDKTSSTRTGGFGSTDRECATDTSIKSLSTSEIVRKCLHLKLSWYQRILLALTDRFLAKRYIGERGNKLCL